MSMILDPASEVEQPIIIEKEQPRRKLRWNWEHAALGGVLLLAAFLGLWNLSINGYSNQYYAAAVKSMIQSWHNFFFVSFDPGGFVTVDKPPIAFWVQAAFAKVLGFNGVTLLLPEALAGVGSVFLVYLMVKRAFGSVAGLLAGLVLAVTPIFVVMNRDNNPDSILVFTLILAAWAMLRAAEKGHLRWLLLAGALVGVAFNVKMLEAYIVLPAFYAMYFFFARTGWRKRILHLTLASLVIVVISFSWAVAVDLTPTSQRPYVDSSAVNSELDLILNYNGLGRVDGNEMTGTGGGTAPTLTDGTAITPPSAGTTTSGTGSTTTATDGTTNGTTTTVRQDGGPGGGGGFGGQAGATRLITPQNAVEFNWFMPLALVGLIYLMAYAWFGMAKGVERSRRLQLIALWGAWLLVFGIVFSFSKGTFHSYYLTIMAPAQAVLAGSALVMLWKRYRQGGWLGWLLPVTLAATAFYQAYILSAYTSWNWWLSPVLMVVGVIAPVGLVLGRLWRFERFGRTLALGTIGLSFAGLLAAPTALSVRAVFTAISGSIVSASPSGNGGQGGPNNSSTSTGLSQTWLNFLTHNLSGQLILAAVVVSLAVGLLVLRRLTGKTRFFNRPALIGLLLVMFLVGSSGWWVNVASAQPPTTTASATSIRDGEFGGFGGNGGGPGSTQADSQMTSYLLANQNGYKYLVAVSSSQSASSIILATDQPVMSIGGFTGSDKTITTTAQLQQLIANHTVRYFILGGNGGPGGGSSSVVSQYVQQNCQVVSYSTGTTTTTAASSSSAATTTTTAATSTSTDTRSTTSQQQQLYVCGS